MKRQEQPPRWQERLGSIDCRVEELEMPLTGSSTPEQDQEWCRVRIDGTWQDIRFHDYPRIYGIPGLYEKLFCERLACCSPSRVVRFLRETLRDNDVDPRDVRVLDLGAGNGMIGDELVHAGIEHVVGIDLCPEAARAVNRDRPGVYRDYLVTDLTALSLEEERRLREERFNALTAVAALSFGMPAPAFLRGLSLTDTPAWTAFNIREDFFENPGASSVARAVRNLISDGILRVHTWCRYRHRLSVSGRPLFYVAVVAEKVAPITASPVDGRGRNTP